jgi:diguanylate cyclase (GGDEF)-like protein
MKLGIAKRISLAFGLLLFLFFITAAVGYLLTTRIEQSVDELTDPNQFQTEPIHTMKDALASTLETQRRQIGSETPVDVWVRPYEAARKQFKAAAAGGIDASTGGAVDAELGELFDKGQRLDALSTEQRKASHDIQDRGRRIAAHLAEGSGADAAQRELALWIERLPPAAIAYARNSNPGLLDTTAEAVRANGELTSLREATQTDEAAQRWLKRLNAEFAELLTTVTRLIEASDARARLMADFEASAARTARLLDGEVLKSIQMLRALARSSADTAISQLIIYLCVMTAFGGLMGASAALVLIRGIVRPLVALTEGARAMGSGQLDYRINLEGDDEFGKLATSINRMAERRLRSEEALRQAANQDSLTRLPNRVVFQDRLGEALDGANRIDRLVAVLMLDLDHFKDVNDTLGHPAGDALLKQVADRLTECARKSDTVSRLGGDEFGIIMTNLNSVTGVEVLARRIINSVGRPFELDGERVFTGTSIGITVYPHDDRDPDKLIKNADMALYRAKQEGRNKYVLYDAQMNAVVQERKALEQDLRDALAADDLFINYQPKLDLESGRIVGAEALVRWYHEGRGMVSPGQFIPVAEDAGLITGITDLVLRKVCRQIREWLDAGLEAPRISLNLSPADFKRENLSNVIKQNLADSRLDPRYLELEITEGMAMGMSDSITDLLNEMRSLGIRIDIDDFGTGYSSMAYLSRFPIDALKIDQTFVRNIVTDSDSANITSAIIHLAQSLHLDVVAEGVEDKEQFEFLRERGCTEIQGYWISRPVHATGFMDFMQKHNAGVAAESALVGQRSG